MKNRLIDFIKGIGIGIANVIPGFSGGTMAVILKVYERIIYAFGHFFTSPIKVIKDIWSLALGLILGIIIAILAITKLLALYPVATVLFFVGLIIGSIPNIYSSTKQYGSLNYKDIIGLLLAIVIIVIIPLFDTKIIAEVEITFGLIMIIFVMGLICSIAMIIPGVSGSLILMAFGYYVFLMTSIGELLNKVLSFDFNGISDLIFVVLSFALGAVIGIVFISKLIEKMLEKFPRLVYSIILGLLIASPFAIIYAVVNEYESAINLSNPITIIVGIISLAIGTFLSGFLPFYIEKKKKEISKASEETE